jgi:hypothetical protein
MRQLTFVVRIPATASSPALTSAEGYGVDHGQRHGSADRSPAPANVTCWHWRRRGLVRSPRHRWSTRHARTTNDNSGSATSRVTACRPETSSRSETTTVTYTATDACRQLRRRATQTVTVVDDTAPSLTAPAPTTVAPPTGNSRRFRMSLQGVDISERITCGGVNGDARSFGGNRRRSRHAQTITLTATDSAGNTTHRLNVVTLLKTR